jgi:hypothetical protein
MISKKLSEKELRLVEWIIELLQEHIKKLVAMRTKEATKTPGPVFNKPPEGKSSPNDLRHIIKLVRKGNKDAHVTEAPELATEAPGPVFYQPPEGNTSMDEVAEIIRLPKFDVNNSIAAEDIRSAVISQDVTQQLKDFVSIIASMYHSNAFHNFGR